MPFFRKPQYSTVRSSKKDDIPQGLWTKCKGCGVVIYQNKINNNLKVCPECDYHYPLTAWERIAGLTDDESFEEIDSDLSSVDALEFCNNQVYTEKMTAHQKKTGLKDAIICGTASLDQRKLALGVMDFRFLGASMGSVVGEKFTRLAEKATSEQLPLAAITASGGARMYEGMLSLMQMAKTSGALARHRQNGLPYIVIMTHPTTAGVSASFASLGDVILAEPGALIGFAGPRVVKQTTQSELPPGFQTAEFLVRHGFIDRVVSRANLRRELSLFLEYFSGALTGKVNS